MKKLLIALLMIFSVAAYAQNSVGDKITYRVTAYKKGNNNVVSVSNYSSVEQPSHLFIPKAFTPNDDGINDGFMVKGENIEGYHIRIYNRWGEVVFESSNLADYWNGRFKGEPVAGGTYSYEVLTRGLEHRPKTGSVTVLR